MNVTVLGIDLGTTNSTASVATMAAAGPTIKTLNLDQETLQGTYTHTLVPSVVALAHGREWVGEGAKRLRGHGTELYASIFHDCKNDIGLAKTYHRAPEGYRSATEIGGKVLRFLHGAALKEYLSTDGQLPHLQRLERLVKGKQLAVRTAASPPTKQSAPLKDDREDLLDAL